MLLQMRRAISFGVSVGIEPIEQQLRDALLLAQHGAARGLGRSAR